VVAYVFFMYQTYTKSTTTAKVYNFDETKITCQTDKKCDVIIQDPNWNYKNDNLTYRCVLLHYLSNVLFEIYCKIKSAKKKLRIHLRKNMIEKT